MSDATTLNLELTLACMRELVLVLRSPAVASAISAPAPATGGCGELGESAIDALGLAMGLAVGLARAARALSAAPWASLGLVKGALGGAWRWPPGSEPAFARSSDACHEAAVQSSSA